MSAPPEVAREVVDTLARINAAWREGRPREMAPFLSEHIAMVPPGFEARLEGRDALIASFVAFARQARVQEFTHGAVVVDGTAAGVVAQYPFEMVYERDGARWRSKGWDVWAFARAESGAWIAVWRTMQAVEEQPA